MEGKLLTLGCYCFSSTVALLTLVQGHFIMGCPAATMLSTGLTDEGECSQLWWQESRLRQLDKDQPLSGVKTAKKERYKKDDPAFFPPKPSKWWQIDLLCSSRLSASRSGLHSAGSCNCHAKGINACDWQEQSSLYNNTLRSIDCVTALFLGRCQSCQSYELISGGSHPSEWLIQHRYVLESNLFYPLGWSRWKFVCYSVSRKQKSPSCICTATRYIPCLIFTRQCLCLGPNCTSDLLKPTSAWGELSVVHMCDQRRPHIWSHVSVFGTPYQRN